MKINKIVLIALAATLGFAACTQDDDPALEKTDRIQFKASIEGTTPALRASINEDTGIGSFENGDVWGMYVSTYDNGSNIILDNLAYTVGTTELFWSNLDEDNNLNFGVHYPRITETIDNPQFYEFDVTTAADPDLLFAYDYKGKGSEVELVFKHLMHRLEINVSKDPGVPGNLSDVEVTLLNMNSSCFISLLDGSVTLNNGGEAKNPYPAKTGAKVKFIVPSQELTKDTDWIQVKLNGKTYIYPVPACVYGDDPDDSLARLLIQGRRLILNLTLKESGSVTGSMGGVGENFNPGGGSPWN